MEPIAASSTAPLLRAGALSSVEVGAVLRNGRILAGEVLSQTGQGLILAIGRQRIPAQTNVALELGRRLFFRVEETAQGILLHVLGDVESTEPELLQALRRVVGQERPLAEALSALAARLRAEIAAGTRPEALGSTLARIEAHAFRPGEGPEALQAALERSGLRYEAALFAALRGGFDPAKLDALRADLKAELLGILGELEDGPLRDSVSRTLAGLEAEQLLNLARQRAGEPLQWSLPLFDGTTWTTARLLFSVDPDDGHEVEDEGERTERLVLGLSLSNTGPLRADVALAPKSLTLRLVVLRKDLAELITQDLESLGELLQRDDRRVQLSVRVGSISEVDLGAHPFDVRFLRDHPLMDRSA